MITQTIAKEHGERDRLWLATMDNLTHGDPAASPFSLVCRRGRPGRQRSRSSRERSTDFQGGIVVLGVSGAITIGILASSPVPPQGVTPGAQSVPQFVVEAANTSLSDFAFALTEAGLSAGFIAADSDVVAGPLKVWHSVALNWAEMPREDLLGAFRARHPAYEIEERAGVLQVRPRELVTATLLSARRNRLQLNHAPLGVAFQEAMRVVNPLIPVRDGGVVSAVVRPGEQRPAAMNLVVSIDLPSASFLDALNEIVRRTPGTVWLLTECAKSQEQATFYTLAYLTPGGWMTQFHDPLR